MRRVLSRVGWVLIASAAIALVGLVLQVLGIIPAHYTWLTPFDILREVVARPHFPTALVVVWLLGTARRTGWKLPKVTAAVGPLVRRWPEALGAVSALVLDVLIFPTHTWLDHLLLAGAGAVLVAHLRSPKEIRHALGYLLWTIAAFTLVSFGYSAVKSALFLGREPLDDVLIASETALFGQPLHLVVIHLVQTQLWIGNFLDWVYFSFFDHMLLTSALLIGMRQDAERNQFVAALVFCYVLGGPLYYLCPAVGPAFARPDDFAFLATHAPRADMIERMLLHNTRLAIERSSQTLATFGYLASMPSLHVAHELVMVWFARRSKIALSMAILFAIATVLSTLYLGWHYFLDALGGALVALIAVRLAFRLRKSLAPPFLQRPDAPLP